MSKYIPKHLFLKLFNTETRQKEELSQNNSSPIKMYTCGPTVYNFAHIGNFRTYVFEDLLRRTIKFFGFPLTQVMNLTDVDDKTIKGALSKNISLKEYTKPYEIAFFEDLQTLNIERAEFYPEATQYIGEMIKIIATLFEKGVAYKGADGSIYFSIDKFPSYGRLSRLNLDELKKGASERVAADEYDKENAADFVLWKAYDPERDGNIFWESPFGKGRPGWHIECSAMSLKLLGENLDIHCGGVDNMFPHHENEIAQSESYTGKHFVKHWLHAEHLIVDGKKMSKSLGNFFTLRDLLKKGYTGAEVRYLLLQTHYRTQLNFTFQGLDGAKNTLQRLKDFVLRLQSVKNEHSEKIAPLIQKSAKEFCTALADDLNISAALAALFDFVRETNSLLDQNVIGVQDAQKALSFLEDLDTVLGVLPLKQESQAIPQNVLDALQKREEARAKKEWKKSDDLRDYIKSCGYVIEDTVQGGRLKKQ